MLAQPGVAGGLNGCFSGAGRGSEQAGLCRWKFAYDSPKLANCDDAVECYADPNRSKGTDELLAERGP
jgi:hypothetical protein